MKKIFAIIIAIITIRSETIAENTFINFLATILAFFICSCLFFPDSISTLIVIASPNPCINTCDIFLICITIICTAYSVGPILDTKILTMN